jgi:alkanesulfonate monooxygenase
MKLFWFIPTFGDSRYLVSLKGARRTTFGYLRQIAQAVDELGYYGALLPTGRSCDDAWVVASSLFPFTRRKRFLVAVRPGLMSPTLTARMVASFDQMSEGRLLINVVTGGDPVELAADGLLLDHDERYRLTDEFLTIFRGVSAQESVDFKGQHLEVCGAKLLFPGVQKPYPDLYFGGSSPAVGRPCRAISLRVWFPGLKPGAVLCSPFGRLEHAQEMSKLQGGCFQFPAHGRCKQRPFRR